MAAPSPDTARTPLGLRDFRLLLASIAFATLATRSLAVVVGFQVYTLTRNPLALGWLGLAEAIPAISLSLFGGYVADRTDRRRIVLVTEGVLVLAGLALALLSRGGASAGVLVIYGVVFVAGIARGFADPAMTAFEAQVVPQALYVKASAWLSSAWQGCAIIGPTLAGFAYEWLGPARTYGMIATMSAASWISISLIPSHGEPATPPRESVLASIGEGVRYVFRSQALVGSMALDLFAVLFGGAVALLPVFATDILGIGPGGLGLLNAAPSVGALLVMLWSTRRPPVRHAGRILLLSVAGFGVSMIVFALSRNVFLSLAALVASGAFDGISMVIRRTIIRLLSPDHLRGRISAVSWIFIGSSNEIGAFESGVAASLLGTVRSVWLGGAVTLLVVALTAMLAPRLRTLSLESAAGEGSAQNGTQA